VPAPYGDHGDHSETQNGQNEAYASHFGQVAVHGMNDQVEAWKNYDQNQHGNPQSVVQAFVCSCTVVRVWVNRHAHVSANLELQTAETDDGQEVCFEDDQYLEEDHEVDQNHVLEQATVVVLLDLIA